LGTRTPRAGDFFFKMGTLPGSTHQIDLVISRIKEILRPLQIVG
jgi:hypothetical protein